MNKRLFPLLLLAALLVGSCGRNECSVSIGATNFSIEPNSAAYYGLNNPGGYMYFSGGHRGVVIIRLSYDSFVAYERTCPDDNKTPVSVSQEWGSSVLECPSCHSRFLVEGEGMPLDGSATACPLYQYSASYSGGVLWVF